MLHIESSDENRQRVEVASNLSKSGENATEILLATARITVQNHQEKWECFRALLDSGSQMSFVTEEAADRLGLRRKEVSVEVSGVRPTGAGTVRGKIKVKIKPRFPSSFKIKSNLLIPRLRIQIHKKWTLSRPSLQGSWTN